MKFKNHIEVQAGIKDSDNSIGSEGQILSSTGEVDQKVEWINQSAITASSDFIYYEVKNETGSTILKGKGVMAVGTDGNSGHILVDEMVADGTIIPRYFLGVLETDIENGGFARAIAFGELDQFNTNGQNGETWANGQVLWCDPDSPGDFTITEPLGPNVKIPAAFILKASTQGKIQIRVQANEGVKDLYDTKIDSQVDGDVLVWDNTTGVWFNDSTLNVDYTAGKVGIGTTSPSELLHISSLGPARLLIEADTDNVTETDNAQIILKQDGGAVIGNLGYKTDTNGIEITNQYAAADGILTFGTSGTERMRVTHTGSVGIGTTSPGSKLQVDGEIDANGADGYRINGKPWANESSNVLRLGDFDGEGFSTSVFDENSIETLRVVDQGVIISSNTSKTPAYGSAANLVVGGSKFSSYGEGVLTLLNNDPTSNAGDQTGSIQFAIKDDAIGGYVSSSITGSINQNAGSGSSGGGVLDFKTSLGTTGSAPQTRMRIDKFGNVGIGTTSPRTKLHVTGLTGDDDPALGSSTAPFFVSNTANSYGLNIGVNNVGASWLQSQSNTSSIAYNLLLNPLGGNVGIGTTSPDSKLHVYANNDNAPTVLTIENGDLGVVAGQDLSKIEFLTNDESSPGAGVAASIRTVCQNAGNIFDLAFNTQNVSTRTETMRLTGAGNLGIGTSIPQEKVHILGSSNVRLEVEATDSTVAALKLTNTAGSYASFVNAAGDLSTFHYNTSTTRTTLLANGNLGINNTSPATKLDVGGGIKLANDTDTPSASKAGTFRYRTSGNNSYVDMCMQTGASSYAWVNIVTNNW